MDFVSLLENFGLPTVVVFACGWFIYMIVTRYMDRSEKLQEQLIGANKESSKSLEKVADTIEKSNALNSELSETNRLLVDKIEGELSTINNNIEKVLDKLE